MENRRTDRRDVALSAEVYTRSEKTIGAGTANMSDDGVCLTVADWLPEEALVGVSLFPVDDGIEDPDAEPINLPAKVVWCDKKHGPLIMAGMRFVDPEDI